MNNSIFKIVSLIAISFVSNVHAQEALVKVGVYRGRNVFVQNPYDQKTKSYCIQSIEVNGRTVLSNPNSSALTVDLSNLTLNDMVRLTIYHNKDCQPKILNPRVLQSGAGYSIVQTLADDASVSWITTGEEDKNAYYELQKQKLDGWETIKKLPAKGDIDNNQYSVGVVHYSGDNEFRIHYVSKFSETYSDTFNFYSAADPISFYPIDKVDELISLSKPTDYIIKDSDGNILKKGVGQDIYVAELKPGEYTLVIENREELFFKPEPEEELPPVQKRRKKRSKNDGSTRR